MENSLREKRLKRLGGDSLSCFPLPAADPSPLLQPPAPHWQAAPPRISHYRTSLVRHSLPPSRGAGGGGGAGSLLHTVLSASHVARLMFMDIGKHTGGRPTTHWDSSELVSDTLLSPPPHLCTFQGSLWFLVQKYMLSPLPLKARLLGKALIAFIQCFCWKEIQHEVFSVPVIKASSGAVHRVLERNLRRPAMEPRPWCFHATYWGENMCLMSQ